MTIAITMPPTKHVAATITAAKHSVRWRTLIPLAMRARRLETIDSGTGW